MPKRKSEMTVHAKRRQRGATLIEVLVSMLLMSMTLMGLAGLLGLASRMQLGVEAQATANRLLNDLGNRIRANLDTTNPADRATWATHYTTLSVATKTWTQQQSTTTTPTKNCTTASCTRAERAEFDVAEIRGQMARTMAQPALLLSGDASAGLVASFVWFDKDLTSVDTNQAVQLTVSATCASTDTALQAQTCCPAAASVGSTGGVRCLNLGLLP
jgi:type IV pilus assembly protein PilV